jgi:HD-GYP domain-containing protein (c-di-GMP phosphodiesterase class II)
MQTPDVAIGQERRRADRWLLSLYRKLGDDAAARAALADEADTLHAAMAERLRLATRLGGSSGIEVLAGGEGGGTFEPGSVLERFAANAAALEEGSGAHCLRTAILVRGLAEDYGCEPQESSDAEAAAGVHDMGKACVMPAILLKEGRHDEFEIEAFREHAMRGAALLEADGTLTRGAIEAVRHHHERWDGGGFPFGLAGTAIPLGARLVGICEAFDEMIHSTAHKREPMSVRRALEELLRQRGRRFDPQLVDLLIERVRRLQRDEGGLDEAVEAEADRSTYVLARRQMQTMLNEAPAGPGGDGA